MPFDCPDELDLKFKDVRQGRMRGGNLCENSIIGKIYQRGGVNRFLLVNMTNLFGVLKALKMLS